MIEKQKSIILPPPNVSGNLHIGHTLNISIIQTILNSYKVYDYETTIYSGLDHGGMSTEIGAENFYNIPKNVAPKQKYEYINSFANECKKNICYQLNTLGVIVDSNSIPWTLNNQHKKLVYNTFINLYKRGYIYEKRTIVNWDTYFKTAISDLEITHIEQEDTLYTISYKINEILDIKVATTRPETIFADCAIAVNPNDIRYKNYIGMYAYIPIINKQIPIIESNDVSIEFGTGALKITPAHSEFDFKIIQNFDIKYINIIDENGYLAFNELNPHEQILASEYSGLNINIARELIGNKISLEQQKIKHSVPFSSKSNVRIEYILSRQWFLSTKQASKMVIDELDTVDIKPKEYKNLLLTWLYNTHDWCISRSNVWGHKMPVFIHTSDTGIRHALTSDTDDDFIIVDGLEYSRVPFVLDTWFSSSLWQLNFGKTTILVTAYDIIYFWVGRMFMMSKLLGYSLPFSALYIHGLVRDSKGQKMSKSRGNVINPLEIIQEKNISVDILKLSLFSSIVPYADIKYNFDYSVMEIKKVLTKIKNCHNYIQKYVIHNMSDAQIIPEKLQFIYSYFIGKIEIIQNKYFKYLNELSLHLLWPLLYEWLYEICDWLIELHKIEHTSGILGYVLYSNYYVLIKMLLIFLPNDLKDMFAELQNTFNYTFCSYQEDTKYNNIINEFKNFQELIKDLRYLSTIGSVTINCDKYDIWIQGLTSVRVDDVTSKIQLQSYNISVIANTKSINISKFEKRRIELEKFFSLDTSKISNEILLDKKNEYNNIINKLHLISLIMKIK